MTMTESSRSTRAVLMLVGTVLLLALAVIGLGVTAAVLADRPEVTHTSGEVVNVSSHAIVIDTPDGRINGLLASEEDVRIGDLVQVTVVEEPNVLVVEVRD